MSHERRKKLFRCAQKLQHIANGRATPEAAEYFFRNFLRLDRVVRGLHPFHNTLPAPVLAEPESLTRSTDRQCGVGGEARESTTGSPTANPVTDADSRGGQNTLGGIGGLKCNGQTGNAGAVSSFVSKHTKNTH